MNLRVTKHIMPTALIFLIAISGCQYFLPQNPLQTKKISFSQSGGMQTDINYQRIDVFDNYQDYSGFISKLSTFKKEFPDFDDTKSTMVVVFLYAEPCSFVPTVDKVIKSSEKNTSFSHAYNSVTIVTSNTIVSENQCDTSHTKGYYANFITFDKIEKSIDVGMEITNENYSI